MATKTLLKKKTSNVQPDVHIGITCMPHMQIKARRVRILYGRRHACLDIFKHSLTAKAELVGVVCVFVSAIHQRFHSDQWNRKVGLHIETNRLRGLEILRPFYSFDRRLSGLFANDLVAYKI